MDLQLAFRVIWRFRVLVALGLLIGVMLAFLAMVRVNLSSSPHFAYRTDPQYESLTTVFVTTHGFPWGSLTLRAGNKTADAPRGSVNTSTLRDFTSLYMQLATSDPVMRRLKQSGPIHGLITAYPVFSADNSTLPLITLSAVAHSKAQARDLARRHLHAFQSWLLNQQTEAGTQPENRVVLQAVSGPLPPHLLRGRKLTKPLLIFLAMLVVTLGLAFVLENVRPRVRSVEQPDTEGDAPVAPPKRLTA
jgi:capsular polysaccharide biosynthesis protein